MTIKQELWDPRPKEQEKALLYRTEELRNVKSSIKNHTITVVLGPRRIGKTSLVKTALNSLQGEGYLPIYVNLWNLQNYSVKSLFSIIRDAAFSTTGALGLSDKLAQFLVRTRDTSKEVSGGIPVLSGSRTTGTQFSEERSLLAALDMLAKEEGKTVVVALDEAQDMSKVKPMNFQKFLAGALDTYSSVKFVLTGSYVGIMKALTSPTKEDPLFQRDLNQIHVKRLSLEAEIGLLVELLKAKEKRIIHDQKELSPDSIPSLLEARFKLMRVSGVLLGTLSAFVTSQIGTIISYGIIKGISERASTNAPSLPIDSIIGEAVQKDMGEVPTPYKDLGARLGFEDALSIILRSGLPDFPIKIVNMIDTDSIGFGELFLLAIEVLKVASVTVCDEVRHFSESALYRSVLLILKDKPMEWGQLKDEAERRLGKTVYDSNLNKALTTLRNLGYVDANDQEPSEEKAVLYYVQDPILLYALQTNQCEL